MLAGDACDGAMLVGDACDGAMLAGDACDGAAFAAMGTVDPASDAKGFAWRASCDAAMRFDCDAACFVLRLFCCDAMR
jgi:hypothetical protein